jgi:hypothetical protein
MLDGACEASHQILASNDAMVPLMLEMSQSSI